MTVTKDNGIPQDLDTTRRQEGMLAPQTQLMKLAKSYSDNRKDHKSQRKQVTVAKENVLDITVLHTRELTAAVTT